MGVSFFFPDRPFVVRPKCRITVPVAHSDPRREPGRPRQSRALSLSGMTTGFHPEPLIKRTVYKPDLPHQRPRDLSFSTVRVETTLYRELKVNFGIILTLTFGVPTRGDGSSSRSSSPTSPFRESTVRSSSLHAPDTPSGVWDGTEEVQ